MKYIFFVVVLFALSISGCSSSSVVTDDGISRFELMSSHNIERYKRNLPQLEYNEELEQRAQSWAEYMAKKNSLKHGSLKGTSFNYVGENIAWGQMSVDKVTDAWMKSPGHKANILNSNFNNVGFGYARREDGSPYWCAQFGGP